MNKTPELLAPVGGWEQLKAAVNNGADAVYIGGSVFNARMKADNFRGDDMKAVIDYCHERGVKVYVTLNTLIKDTELAKAFAYAAELYAQGADGLIIQDMGIARLIKKYLPDMPMHLSTQGTVYNKWAADLAKEMGFCRIVPARELTLDEIGQMTAACHELDMEVEIFVHGALCMCYSGQCQMSRLLGVGGGSKNGKGLPSGRSRDRLPSGRNRDGLPSGRSGNRGLCAQPCRLLYTDDSGRSSYALSPKDLCLIEDIPALVKAGVDSFKIEGRLKSPEYVAVVTRIYRKYLDKYEQLAACGREDAYAVDPEDMKMLRQIFNRGDFTKGYLYGNPGEEILSGSSPKNQGLYAGRVVGLQDVKKDRARTLIDVDTRGAECDTIALGDGVELPMTDNVVTYVKNLGKGIVRIGDFKGAVEVGDEVRKVTDRALIERALGENAEGKEVDGRAVLPANRVDMRLVAAEGAVPRLQMRAGGATAVVRGEDILEQALNRPADPERLSAQLAKLGSTPFEAGRIDVDIDGNPMIPISVVNGLRRRAVEELLAVRRQVNRETLTKEEITAVVEETKSRMEKERGSGGADRVAGGKLGRTRLVPLELFMKGDREDAIPYILNVSKGNLDRYIEEHFEDICRQVKDCGIATGNLGWIRRFQSAGVKVYGDYGLNVMNRQAAEAFAEAGVQMIAWSDEMSEDGRHVMASSAGQLERQPKILERIPLMITEHPLETEILTDRKNEQHKVVQWYSKDKYLIF
ncbi:MAG: U32 family peptidase [Firmicutes bacterium]|nr:U32 family peptidase [Bacillota bacterium]